MRFISVRKRSLPRGGRIVNGKEAGPGISASESAPAQNDFTRPGWRELKRRERRAPRTTAVSRSARDQPQHIGPASRVEYFQRGDSCEAAAAGRRHSRGPPDWSHSAVLRPLKLSTVRRILSHTRQPESTLRFASQDGHAAIVRAPRKTCAYSY